MKNHWYNKLPKTQEIPLTSDKKEDIIQWIYDTHIVEWYTTLLLHKGLDDEDTADKVQEIYLMLCEIPDEKWKDLYKQGRVSVGAYVTGVIHQQIVSKNSLIFYKYNKHEIMELKKDDLFWEKYDEENEKCEI